jgi:MFS family permease
MNDTTKHNEKSEKLLDHIIDKYGYGPITWKTFTVVFFIISLEGFHLTFFGNMIIPLKQHYSMNDSHVQWVSSFFFLAVGIGSYSAGYVAERFKRMNILYATQMTLAVAHFFMGIGNNMIVFALLRVVIGYCIGVAVPISLNLLTEYLPIHFRSILLTGAWMGFVFGQLYNLVLLLLFMPNYEVESFSTTIFVSSSLSILLFFLTFFLVRDSPRNLLLTGEVNEAIDILEHLNGGKLTQEQKDEIIAETFSGANLEFKASIKEIFHHDLKKTSILLIFIWLINSLLTYGPILISSLTIKELDLEQHDSKNRDIILQQIIIVIISSPSNVLGGFFSEIPILGRNKTVILSFIFAILFNILTIVNNHNYEFHFGMYLFFTSIGFNVNTTYSCEIYPTRVRDIAIGFLFFCTRVGGFISQIIFIAFNNLGMWIPYYASTALCCVNIALVFILPVETYDRPLDEEIDEHPHIRDNDKKGYETINELE